MVDQVFGKKKWMLFMKKGEKIVYRVSDLQ